MIQSQIEKAKFPNHWQLVTTKRGKHTLLVAGKPLHSRVDPENEAARWVEREAFGNADILIIHEAGLGYVYTALQTELEQRDKLGKPYKAVIFINETNGLFAIGRNLLIIPQNNPVKCYNTPIFFSEPDNENDISLFLDEIDLSGSTGHRIHYTPVPSEKNALLSRLLQTMASILSDLLTRVEFEQQWIEQIAANAPQLFRSKASHYLFRKWPNHPVIIIGAGPSLIEGLDYLRKWQHKALLVATDTAFGPLMQNNVIPDMVYTLDSQRHSLFHFLPYLHLTETKQVHLIADIVASPDLIRVWPGPIWFATTAKYQIKNGVEKRITTPMADWLENAVGPLGDIQSGGSVATSAFDLVRQMGCQPIVFIGQDLAYIGREIHARGTHHQNKWLSQTHRKSNLDQINQQIINKRSIRFVPTLRSQSKANYKSETMITDYVFHLYHHWFEEAFQLTGLQVFFPENQGAWFKGARIAPYAEIDEIINRKSKYKKNKFNEVSQPGFLHNLWELCPPFREKWVDHFQQLNLNIKQQTSEAEEYSKNNPTKALNSLQKLTEDYPFLEIYLRKINILLKRQANRNSQPNAEGIQENLTQAVMAIIVDMRGLCLRLDKILYKQGLLDIKQ